MSALLKKRYVAWWVVVLRRRVVRADRLLRRLLVSLSGVVRSLFLDVEEDLGARLVGA